AVENQGVIRFDEVGVEGQRGGQGEQGRRATRVDIKLTYTPPLGTLGHVAASLFGADPKSEMDADLLRLKTVIERGRTPHDAAQGGAVGKVRSGPPQAASRSARQSSGRALATRARWSSSSVCIAMCRTRWMTRVASSSGRLSCLAMTVK